ncbi:MAG: FGGY family carbohydrate kinase, partial [Nakamurella sp.]
MSAAFAAVDLGASSGRVILGHVGPGTLVMTETRRFRNGPVRLPDGLYWDILGLYQDVLVGLRDAHRQDDTIRGIGIDSWAVDYGLVDTGSGRLLGNPRHYRDGRTDATVVDAVHRTVSPRDLYAINGLQYLPFNTLYQFAAEGALPAGARALLVPDLLGYWLTGEQVTEETNASTTGLLDAATGGWSGSLFHALGWSPGLLPRLAAPGTVVGALTAGVRAETGLGGEVS